MTWNSVECESRCFRLCLLALHVLMAYAVQSTHVKNQSWSGMVAYAYKHSTLETEAGGFLHVQAIFSYIVSGLSEIHSQILSQKFQN